MLMKIFHPESFLKMKRSFLWRVTLGVQSQCLTSTLGSYFAEHIEYLNWLYRPLHQFNSFSYSSIMGNYVHLNCCFCAYICIAFSFLIWLPDKMENYFFFTDFFTRLMQLYGFLAIKIVSFSVLDL